MPFTKKHGIPTCNKPGVYYIVNLVNGKVYVGSAISIKGRLSAHRSYLRAGTHDNEYLQRAWIKYGEKSFDFNVIETCEANLCLKLEQYWIDSLKATNRDKGYNICPIAGNAMGGRKHSDESRAKMAASQKLCTHVGKATEAAAIANKGKHRSEETRRKIGEGNKGLVRTAEQIENIKASHWSKRDDASEIAERSAAFNRGRRHSAEHKTKIALAGWSRWKRKRHK